MKSNYYNPNSISITHRFSILFALFVTFIALAVFLSINYFTLLATTFYASLLFFSCGFIILIVILEMHGKSNTNKVSYAGLYVILLIFSIVAVMKFVASTNNPLHDFWAMDKTTPKLLLTLIFSYIVSIKISMIIYLKLKSYTKNKHLWLRYISASFVLFTLFTTLLTLISFIGIIEIKLLLQLLCSNLLLQYIFIVITLPIIYGIILLFKAFNHKLKRGSHEKHNANYAKSSTSAKKYRGYTRTNQSR